jgi:hypothetical protein
VPLPPKSIAVGLAQFWLLVLLTIVLYATYDGVRRIVAEGGPELWWLTLAVRTLPMLCACGAMIVGMQRRLGWARVGTGVVIAAMAGLQLLGGAASGSIGGAIVSVSLQLLLAWRVVFGEPSRAYFAGKPVTPVRSFEES